MFQKIIQITKMVPKAKNGMIFHKQKLSALLRGIILKIMVIFII